ncbi:MAG: helix-turn-helix transcriptional regulator [Saprospiraceae bacterium]|nr:helix-turn-helix transcriptional regulator [Saprospiraceae bacterium]
MFTKEELLEDPEYLLARYQNEIYYQLDTFMSKNNFTQSEIASKLGVSSSYVSQVLNGNFNFTLKS